MRITLQEAAHLLIDGHVVAVPTETVYGLAACLDNPAAVDAIFSLKGRPANNPLIIHLDQTSQLDRYVTALPPDTEFLVEAFWPGPMTLVLPVRPETIPERVRAGLPTAAFRRPHLLLAQELLHLTGPLVMPSANLSGRPSATAPAHVEADFGADFPVLDGGTCERGLESTILIEADGRWRIIRQGALPPEAFTPILGYEPAVDKKPDAAAPLCPGQLYRHYAPHARLRLVKAPPVEGVVLGYRERQYGNCRVIVLGSLANPGEVAENLYRCLRQLDEEGIADASVDVDVPSEGLWKTVLERLTKAAE